MEKLNIGIVMISRKITDNQESPVWMYRELSEKEDDSGWRVFSGTEDDVFLDNPYNFALVDAEGLIEIDDSLKANLFAPVGSSFEKNQLGEWEIIDKGFGFSQS